MAFLLTSIVPLVKKMSIELKKHDSKGQNLIEYAIVTAIVSAAIVAMSTYVFRSVQATQQMIQEEARNE